MKCNMEARLEIIKRPLPLDTAESFGAPAYGALEDDEAVLRIGGESKLSPGV